MKKTILVNNKYKVTLETVHQPKIDQQLVIYQPKDLKIDMFYSARIITVEPWDGYPFSFVLLDSLLSSTEPCAVLEEDCLTVILFDNILRVDLSTRAILQCIECENIGGLEQIHTIDDGYIIKGECDIFRYDNVLNCVWRFSARDIFATNGQNEAFWIVNKEVHCRDWQGWHYVLDMQGKLISEVAEKAFVN